MCLAGDYASADVAMHQLPLTLVVVQIACFGNSFAVALVSNCIFEVVYVAPIVMDEVQSSKLPYHWRKLHLSS